MRKVAVIGGGAAGFFAAITCAHTNPNHRVTIYEKTHKLLAKVGISGGGRCNVTHACFDPVALSAHYPRGQKQLKKAFHTFSAADTVKWFAAAGVKLKTEDDGRMFPVSDSSQTIIDCLMAMARKYGVEIKTGAAITTILPDKGGYLLSQNEQAAVFADHVIIATGGSPKMSGLAWLESLGHTIVPPVPSLFTFNMPNNPIRALMGVAVPEANVRIIGTKLEASGPLLITHWGMSGPAILKLSAWGARTLHQLGYHFTARVNWCQMPNEEVLRQSLADLKALHRKKLMRNLPLFGLPERLWLYLLEKAEVPPNKMWAEISKKEENRWINLLINDQHEVKGKTTFKEEFVTCGGVSLSEIDFATMESKKHKGLYFTGEVLDIDGVTGGFNFQAAWTTGYLAGLAAAR